MPNQITESGITIQSLNEIVDELVTGFKTIYGEDINLEPNSPDAQLINIVAQAKRDMLEVINQVFSSFDPDQAIGVNLDRRCAINGIQRAGGTYTQQPVSVTVDRALTLTGLDTDEATAFTVQDGQGNQYKLVSTHAFSMAETASLIFQAVEVGAVTSALNSITVPVSILLGVVFVNNPTDASTVGVSQETDTALRLRRARSVAIPSQGYLDGLIGALLDLEGVTQAEVFENVTDTEDLRLIPGHSVWVIVAGGEASAIADVIYKKRSLGCGMKGTTSVPVTQIDGIVLDILFDRPISQPLYIKLDVESMSGEIDIDYLRTQLLARLQYNINELADSSEVVAIAKEIYPNGSISQEGVSTDGLEYFSLVSPTTVQHQFTVAEIVINGSVS